MLSKPRLHIVDVTASKQFYFDVPEDYVDKPLMSYVLQQQGKDINGQIVKLHKRYLYECKYGRCGKPLNVYEMMLTNNYSVCVSSSPYEYVEKHPKRFNCKLAWIKQFKIHNTPSDGNCFFHAVVQSLYYCYFDKLLEWNNETDFDNEFDFSLNQPPMFPRFVTTDALLRVQAPDQLRILIGYYLIKFYGFWDANLNASEYVDTWFHAEFTDKTKKFVKISARGHDMKEITIDTSFFTDKLENTEFADIPDALIEGVDQTIVGRPYVRTPRQWGGDQVITLFINSIFDVNVIQYDDETISNLFETKGYVDPLPDSNNIILYRRRGHYFWLKTKQGKTV